MSDEAIAEAFHGAWDDFGDDKSTEFLLQMTADRCGVSYNRVVEALANIHGDEVE